VTADLALQVRYAIGAERLAVRFGRLDVDLLSAGPPSHSARLASDIVHDLYTDPGPAAWRDERGYAWWGDVPAAGWPAVVTAERLLTLPG
jgi:hypothetical protein